MAGPQNAQPWSGLTSPPLRDRKKREKVRQTDRQQERAVGENRNKIGKESWRMSKRQGGKEKQGHAEWPSVK